jgi:hypothetical protein
MKLISNQRDYFSNTAYISSKRFKELPIPLPWIEPSINMLYLESVSSFIFGNDFTAILSMSVLLEHVLRLAILDPINCGLARTITEKQLDHVGMISDLIKEALRINLITSNDEDWWKEVGKIIRNKSAHYLLPTILREFSKKEYSSNQKDRDDYSPEYYKFFDKNGNSENDILLDWGSFFHKSGSNFAQAFILQSTEKLNTIISKTKWGPDLSWWISQKEIYDSFFAFDWNFNNMPKSLDKFYVK